MFKSLAMVAIVANTVYLGWAADHNDSWCEGFQFRQARLFKKIVNLTIQSTHDTCQPSVGTSLLASQK